MWVLLRTVVVAALIAMSVTGTVSAKGSKWKQLPNGLPEGMSTEFVRRLGDHAYIFAKSSNGAGALFVLEGEKALPVTFNGEPFAHMPGKCWYVNNRPVFSIYDGKVNGQQLLTVDFDKITSIANKDGPMLVSTDEVYFAAASPDCPYFSVESGLYKLEGSTATKIDAPDGYAERQLSFSKSRLCVSSRHATSILENGEWTNILNKEGKNFKAGTGCFLTGDYLYASNGRGRSEPAGLFWIKKKVAVKIELGKKVSCQAVYDIRKEIILHVVDRTDPAHKRGKPSLMTCKKGKYSPWKQAKKIEENNDLHIRFVGDNGFIHTYDADGNMVIYVMVKGRIARAKLPKEKKLNMTIAFKHHDGVLLVAMYIMAEWQPTGTPKPLKFVSQIDAKGNVSFVEDNKGERLIGDYPSIATTKNGAYVHAKSINGKGGYGILHLK